MEALYLNSASNDFVTVKKICCVSGKKQDYSMGIYAKKLRTKLMLNHLNLGVFLILQ